MQTTKWILKRLKYTGDIFLTDRKEYSIGRGKDNYVSILSIFVSRRHLIFRVTEKGLAIKDLNSSNGTFVNENKIPPNTDIILRVNDCIGVGVPSIGGPDHYVYRLLIEDDQCIANDDVDTILEDENKSIPLEDSEENDVLLIENKNIDIIELSDDEEKPEKISAVCSSSPATSLKPSCQGSFVLTKESSASCSAVQKVTIQCEKNKNNAVFNISDRSDLQSEKTGEQSAQTRISCEKTNFTQSKGSSVYHNTKKSEERDLSICKVKTEPCVDSCIEVEVSKSKKEGSCSTNTFYKNVVKTEEPSNTEVCRSSSSRSLQESAAFGLRISRCNDGNSVCHSIPLSSEVPSESEAVASNIADLSTNIKQEKLSPDLGTTKTNVCSLSKSLKSLPQKIEESNDKKRVVDTAHHNDNLNVDTKSNPVSKVKVEKSSPDKICEKICQGSSRQNLLINESSNLKSFSDITADIIIKEEKLTDDICDYTIKDNRKNTEQTSDGLSIKEAKCTSTPDLGRSESTTPNSQINSDLDVDKCVKLLGSPRECTKQKPSFPVVREEAVVSVPCVNVERQKQILKRSHPKTDVLSRFDVNESLSPVHKKIKFGSVISGNLSNSSSRSSSPSSTKTNLSSTCSVSNTVEDSGRVNPDKWFKERSRPFLDLLEKTVRIKTSNSNPMCNIKTNQSKNISVNTFELQIKEKSGLSSKQKDIDGKFYPLPEFLNPVVLVKRLHLDHTQLNNKRKYFEGDKDSSSNDTLFEEDMEVLTSTSNYAFSDSNIPKPYASLNYSQSDDVIVIDDDDDDDDDDDKDNVSGSNFDNEVHKNIKIEEPQDVHEEIVVKEEIFDDFEDCQLDEYEDDDEVQLVKEWEYKLSQSSQIFEDIKPCAIEDINRSPVNSDISNEDFTLPTERSLPNTNVINNDVFSVSDDTDEEIFTSKRIKWKNNEISRMEENFVSRVDKGGSRSGTKKKIISDNKNRLTFNSVDNDTGDAILDVPDYCDKNCLTDNNSRDTIKNNVFNVPLKQLSSSTNNFDNVLLDGKSSFYDDNEKCSTSHNMSPLQKLYDRKQNEKEDSLHDYVEELQDKSIKVQKDKKKSKSCEKLKNSSDTSAKECDNTTKSSNVAQFSNKRTLMCSALPIKPKSRSKTAFEKDKKGNDEPKKIKPNELNKNSHSSNISHKPKPHKHKSKHTEMKGNKNDISEKEIRSKVKEERKAKLKALTAQKIESSTSKSEVKVPTKPLRLAKNTTSSRGDKLVQSFVSSKTSSENKPEKIKDTKAKGTEDKSSHRLNKVASKTDPLKKIPTKFSNEASKDGAQQDTSVPEIEKQMRNMSFKSAFRIPKLKQSDTLSRDDHANTSEAVKKQKEEKPHKAKPTLIDTVKNKIVKNSKAPSKMASFPLRSCLRNLTVSYPNKCVNFAPDESLCSVQSFSIEHGNTLRRIEGKDAPVRKALANKAEALYDTSKNVINSVVTSILKDWNPRWLQEEKIVAQNGGEPPPAHCEKTPISGLYPMLTAFTSYDEYIKIVHPLMLLDLWARVSEDSNKPNQRTREKYIITVNEKKDLNGLLILSCSMTVTFKQDKEGLYPHAGDLCILRCPMKNSFTTDVNYIPGSQQEKHVERFAYIDSMSRDYRSANNPTWKQGIMKNVSAPVHCVLNFAIKIKGDQRLDFINTSIKVLSSIRSDLRLFEAVGYLEHTRLCKMILSPCILDYKLPYVDAKTRIASQDKLNESQRKAVIQCSKVCLSSSPKLCLIQGPPGTGKTKVIVHLIKEILYSNGQYLKVRWDKKTRILLCAPSNAAADEMAERLLAVRAEMPKEDRFKMVRIGTNECMRESIRGISLDELAKKDVEATLAHQLSLESVELEIATLEARRRSYVMACEHASSKKESTAMYEKRIQEVEKRLAELKSPMKNVASQKTAEMEREAKKKVVGHADIVVTTLISSFNPQMTDVFATRNGRSVVKFTCCIIDEATQSREPESLIPLMFGIEKVVLVGDPEQLPATVLSQVAKEKSYGQSLFNRIWNKFHNETENPVIFLNTQYRMHPEIYHWPNIYIYHRRILSDISVCTKCPIKPYCLFSHHYLQDNLNLVNSSEALLVSSIAMVVANNFSHHVKTIGIITPYQRQLQEIKRLIERRRTHPVTIVANTIDGFQGRECDVVIFSCVRTRGIGFMSESQRLNVALTRARRSLIICGNFLSLKGDKMWSSLLGDAVQRRVIIDINNVCQSEPFILNSLFQHS